MTSETIIYAIHFIILIAQQLGETQLSIKKMKYARQCTITLVDLAFGAAFVMLNEKTKPVFSYDTIVNYGQLVLTKLEKQGYRAVLAIPEDRTICFTDRIEKAFNCIDEDGTLILSIKEKFIEDGPDCFLRNTWKIPPSPTVLDVMMSEECLSVLYKAA